MTPEEDADPALLSETIAGLQARIAGLHERVDRLNGTITEQQAMINTLSVLAEERLVDSPQADAFDGWRRTLLLNRELQSRIREVGEAEQLLRSVVDSLDSRLCILGENGTIMGANRLWGRLAEQLGWRPHEAGEGADFFDLLSRFGPELARPVETALRAVLAGTAGEQSVKAPVRHGGREDWVIVRMHPVRDHDRARVVVTIIDITEAHRTQEELDRVSAEAKLLALVAQHTDHAVVITDPRGRIEWVNEAFCRATGYSRAEAIGQVRTRLMNPPAPARADVDRFEAEIADGRPGEVYLPSLTKDGELRWLHVQVTTIAEDGVPTRRVAIELDVTGQREAERQLLAANGRAQRLVEALQVEKSLLSDVLSSIPQLVYWKDDRLRYAGVNPAFLELRGLPGGTDVLGGSERDLGLGHDGRGDELAAALATIEPEVLATGARVENRRVVLAATDGSGGPGRSLLLSVLPQTDAGGAVRGVIGVAADVTHVTTLEQQLAQATRLESIGQLAAGIAHEINTPVQYVADNTRFLAQTFDGVLQALHAARELQAGEQGEIARLQGRLDDLDLDFLSAEIPGALAQTQEGLARVAQIVRAMKDFSHPGQGRSEADVNRAVESTTQVCRNEWRYVAELELDLDPAVGMLRCYEGELKQVLLNVVVNAAQAIAEQREHTGSAALGRIEVTTRRLPHGVRITVADDGPGMEPEVQRRIFDPFFTTKPVGKGTGQGLSMAYATVVTKHGGRIEVDSTPGLGTTFTLDLPLH